VEENPFFTKNGKYTYDLELSLDNPQNAKTYKHLNRINNQIAVPENRSACMIVDNEVTLNGTEIILEITDKSVKIQLVSGESEFNYLIGNKQKINELNLGKIPSDNSSFLFVPVYLMDETTGINQIINRRDIRAKSSSDIPYIDSGIANAMYQPLFYKIINRIIAVLGYTISSNILESAKFNQLYIINILDADNFEGILPAWTISELIAELEKFNIVFLIDEINKNMIITTKKDYYTTAKKIVIDNVLDEYTKTIDNENRTDYSNINIGYELTEDEYFDFQNLESAIVDNSEKKLLPSFNDIYHEIYDATDKQQLKNIIYTSQNSNTQYICNKGDVFGSEEYYPKKVNIFRTVINNPESTDIDVSIKIVPAAMRVVDLPVKMSSHPLEEPFYYLRTQMPVMKTIYKSANDDIFDIQEIIEEKIMIEKEKNAIDKIYLMYYSGPRTIYKPDSEYTTTNIKVNYPVPFVDYFYEFNKIGERKISEENLTLRLDDEYGIIKSYTNTEKIDTTEEYLLKFIYKGKLDAKFVFIINNKEFTCKEIRRKININGFEKIIEGIFYAIK
jgi:hypothetical protein